MKETKRTRRRTGRPTKYCPNVVLSICAAVADGAPFKHAAAIGGISFETFCQWRKRFPEFSDAIDAAVAKGVHARLKVIIGSAEGGNLKAATWWLEHVMPEHFSRNRIDLHHRVEADVHHTIAVSPEILSAIADARARHEETKKHQNEKLIDC